MQLKWITLASLVAFAVITVGRSWFGKTTEQELAELTARYPTKDSCLSGAAERIAPCTVPGCYDTGWTFLDRCLTRAEGDRELFCRNVAYMQQDSRGNDLFQTHCEPFMPYRSECDKVILQVGSYCANPVK